MSYTLDETKKKQLDDAVKKMGYSDYAAAYNAIAKTNGLPTITSSDSGATYNQYTTIMKEASKTGAYDRAYQQGDIYKNNASTPETPSTPTTNYSGLIANAEAYKNSAYANADATKNASYAQALKAKEEANALAEIQRKRGVVDASTMAAQERATYGANAEALGRMGLNVSGYSDYINSQAYASGMAARQNANAQATEAKRQATYQEALARLEADKAYAQSKAEADKTYYGLLNEIESAKIADAQAKEEQKQTNYQDFLASIPDGATKEQVKTIAANYGITDETEINKAISYAEAMGYTINDGSTTETTPTVDEGAVSNVFSHQEGEKTVVNTEPEARVKYKEAQEKHKNGEIDDVTWFTIEGTFKMEYENEEGNYVNVYSQTFDEKSFGKFAQGKKQTNLIKSIELMAKGELPTSDGTPLEKGDIVYVNYGVTGFGGAPTRYKYLGNGAFEKLPKWGSDGDSRAVVPEGFVLRNGFVEED